MVQQFLHRAQRTKWDCGSACAVMAVACSVRALTTPSHPPPPEGEVGHAVAHALVGTSCCELDSLVVESISHVLAAQRQQQPQTLAGEGEAAAAAAAASGQLGPGEAVAIPGAPMWLIELQRSFRTTLERWALSERGESSSAQPTNVDGETWTIDLWYALVLLLQHADLPGVFPTLSVSSRSPDSSVRTQSVDVADSSVGVERAGIPAVQNASSAQNQAGGASSADPCLRCRSRNVSFSGFPKLSIRPSNRNRAGPGIHMLTTMLGVDPDYAADPFYANGFNRRSFLDETARVNSLFASAGHLGDAVGAVFDERGDADGQTGSGHLRGIDDLLEHWCTVSQRSVPLSSLATFVESRGPVLLLVDTVVLRRGQRDPRGYHGHYVLLLGYDAASDEFTIADPDRYDDDHGVFSSVASARVESARKTEGTDEDLILLDLVGPALPPPSTSGEYGGVILQEIEDTFGDMLA